MREKSERNKGRNKKRSKIFKGKKRHKRWSEETKQREMKPKW